MKKLLALLAITGFMIACNNDAPKEDRRLCDTSHNSITPAPDTTSRLRERQYYAV